MGLRNSGVVLVVGVFVLALGVGAQQPKAKYSTEEHNDYTAATREQDPQVRLRALEAFLQKYPDSALRPYVFLTCMQIYQASNLAKLVEYADKFLALDPMLVEEVSKRPDLTEQQIKEHVAGLYYRTLSLRARAFLLSSQDKGPQGDAAAEKAAVAAREGLTRLDTLPRPANMTPEKFAEEKKQEAAIFHRVLGTVSFRKKDFDTAAREYKIVVEYDADDALSAYRLGVSYLQATDRQPLPGLWAVARAAALFPEKEKKGVRDYLIRNLVAYQGIAEGCPARHAEAQADELIGQARNSGTPPPTWTLPQGERVMALRSELTVKRIFDELKAGGEQQQLIWVAGCGMELPELTGEVLEVMDSGDNLVTLRLAVGEEAADVKVPTVEVKVKEPPEAKNLKPGIIVGFSGILVDYQAQPFLLRLVEGKVNPEDIPKVEKPAPRPRPRSSP